MAADHHEIIMENIDKTELTILVGFIVAGISILTAAIGWLYLVEWL
jgi:hypothetical protein